MNEFHGIIFAYSASPALRELVRDRTAASLPFCGRYRMIDFALSCMRNAGITDVGVIMQRDYQSLLDHIGSGKAWDMSKNSGGLRMLPPFGLPEHHRGDYSGTIEALNAVRSYIEETPCKYFVLMPGNLCANIDLSAICSFHKSSDAEITAICANYEPDITHHRYIVDRDGYIQQILFDRFGPGEGVPSLESYIINKDTLLRLMDKCKSENCLRFHTGAIAMFLRQGGKMRPYIHRTYARIVNTVDGYYDANMNMLDPVSRSTLFPADRPVRTRNRGGVSTYYGENAKALNSLVADDCIIYGSLENCIVFPGVKIGKGASVKNSIIMKDCCIGDGAELNYVIADKNVYISQELTLTGNRKLPIVIPKDSRI